MEVLEKQRPHGTGPLPALGVLNGGAIGSGVDGLLIITKGGSRGITGGHCGQRARREPRPNGFVCLKYNERWKDKDEGMS